MTEEMTTPAEETSTTPLPAAPPTDSEDFADLIQESLEQLSTASGKILTGIVTDIDDEMVSVYVNLKSEGLIPRSEFDEETEGELERNAEVQVALETVDDGTGATILSHTKARHLGAWAAMEQAYKSGAAVEGYLRSRVKGGFNIEIGTIRAFLPGSLVDIRPMQEVAHLEGEKLQFRIIKLDPERNNMVVSRRAVMLETMSEDQDSLLANLAEGQEYEGIVKNLMVYGAFVDLGGVDGLLHNTDISWKRINHPSEVLAVGDKIRVKVLNFSREDMRISLGMKQLKEDPWQSSSEKFAAGTVHEGKVTGVRDYGCFVELEDSIEGLVHASEMDWSNRKIKPQDHAKIGDTVQVKVLEVDYDRRRISLGMKQCKQNPWEAFAENNAPGTAVEGKVTHISDFGLFVSLAEGLDGLVHISDIAWNRDSEEAIGDYEKGSAVKAIVMSVDIERERISLGIKQLEGNPVNDFAQQHARGDRISVPVVRVEPEELYVRLDDTLTSRMSLKDVTSDHSVDDLRQSIKPGDELEVQILNIDQTRGRVSISATVAEREEQRDAMKKHRAEIEEARGVTLGDVLEEKSEADAGEEDSADS